MASYKKAQVARDKGDFYCEVCKSDIKAKWICIDCKEYVCAECKDKHRTKYKHHTLNQIQSRLMSASVKKEKTEAIKCDIHPTENILFYCKQCSVYICNKCLVQKHKKHDFCDIEESINVQKENMIKFRENIQFYTEVTEKEKLLFLLDRKHDIESTCDEEAVKVKERSIYLQRKIQSVEQSLLAKIDRAKKANLNQITLAERNINERSKEVENITEILENVSEYGTNEAIVKVPAIIQSSLKFLKKPVVYCATDIPKVLSHDVAQKDIERSFGYEQGNKFNEKQSPTVDLTHVSSFRCSPMASDIRCLLPVRNDKAWVSSFDVDYRFLRLYNIYGEIEENIQVDNRIISLVLCKNGDIVGVLTDRDNTWSFKIKPGGNLQDFIDTTPFFPLCLHETKDGSFLIGTVLDITMKAEDQRGQILKYSHDGLMKLKIESLTSSRNTEDKLRRPWSITENSDDIVLIDRQSQISGRVLVIDQRGNLKYSYQGNQNTLVLSQFDPRDLCTDKKGHILVSDWAKYSIHVLDRQAKYLTEIKSQNDMTWPGLSAVSDSEHLWVGEMFGYIHVFKYSIKT